MAGYLASGRLGLGRLQGLAPPQTADWQLRPDPALAGGGRLGLLTQPGGLELATHHLAHGGSLAAAARRGRVGSEAATGQLLATLRRHPSQGSLLSIDEEGGGDAEVHSGGVVAVPARTGRSTNSTTNEADDYIGGFSAAWKTRQATHSDSTDHS